MIRECSRLPEVAAACVTISDVDDDVAPLEAVERSMQELRLALRDALAAGATIADVATQLGVTEDDVLSLLDNPD